MPSIHAILDTVVEGLARNGDADVDVNNVALRYAMDVTGMVCFGAAFGTAAAFNDSHTNDLFAVLRGGALPFQDLLTRAIVGTTPRCSRQVGDDFTRGRQKGIHFKQGLSCAPAGFSALSRILEAIRT